MGECNVFALTRLDLTIESGSVTEETVTEPTGGFDMYTMIYLHIVGI